MGRKVKSIPVWAKIIIGFVLLFIIGAIGASIYLSRKLNNRLGEMVSQASHGLYKLDYRKVSVNALTGNLSILDAQLTPDTAVFAQLQQAHAAPKFLMGGKAEKLQLKNVRWLSYLTNHNLKIGKLLIDQPQFNITKYLDPQDSTQQSPGIYELISKQVNDLRIGLVSINDAAINYQVADTTAGARTVNKIEHLSIGFAKVHFDKDAGKPGLAADDYSIKLKEYRHRTTDSLYWLGISGMDYHSKHKRLKLASFYVEPRFPEKEFSKKLKEQATMYKMKFENIVANGFDMALLTEKGIAIMPEVSIDKGVADIYMDRALPKVSADQVNVSISQKVLHLGFPFAIQLVKLNNIQMQYREFEPISGLTAVLAFDKVSGEATNITTIPEYINRNALMKMSLNGEFLHSAVNARFEFDLSKKDGSFTSWIKASQMEAEKLNPVLTAVAKIEARKGILQELQATVHGTADLASANVSFMYEGLKINVLKIEGDSLTKKGLPSMFANLFIFDDNPKDGVLRTANGVTLRRGFGKSFFNMLWNSISLGIQQIIAKKKGLKFK